MKKRLFGLALALCMALALLPTAAFAEGSAASETATVKIVVEHDWEDGSGYQMLMDSTAKAYGVQIPKSGPLASGDSTEEVYKAFDHKIPADAGWTRDTKAIVKPGNSYTIQIPAGVYDYCITNPTPNEKIWIAGSGATRANDYEFKAGCVYTFTIKKFGSFDGADLVIKDIVPPVISGLEDGKTYCGDVEFTVADNVAVSRVTVDGTEIQPVNGSYTLRAAEGTQTVVAYDADGNTATATVTVNSEHTYDWQSENGQYWQKCKVCNAETEKKPIPTLTINAPDTVCRTQDTKFSFALPEGCKTAEAGYAFPSMGSDVDLTEASGVYSGVIETDCYEDGVTEFELMVSGYTADGYFVSASKTITIQNEHTGGKADCHTKAICAVCGESYGEFDAANHTGGTEVRGAKAATCTADGYTGDTYCKGCGAKLESGAVLPQRHPMLTKVEEQAATAEQTGTKAHWHCATCNGDFADAAGTQKLTAAELTIPKLTVEKKDDKKAEAGKDEVKKASPKTADTAVPVLALAAMALAGAGLAVTKRKEK